MPRRVSPTERIRVEIDDLFGSQRPIEECLEEAMRLSVRLVLQEVLEEEVTGWLGRDGLPLESWRVNLRLVCEVPVAAGRGS